jgi:hypothetical protein
MNVFLYLDSLFSIERGRDTDKSVDLHHLYIGGEGSSLSIGGDVDDGAIDDISYDSLQVPYRWNDFL